MFRESIPKLQPDSVKWNTSPKLVNFDFFAQKCTCEYVQRWEQD